MAEFRVELEAFSGPMDLLLHLVQEQEVDVRDFSISLLLQGYLAHLERMREIDLGEAADFLVMASTLLEIKSRELLPREEVDLDRVLDPRDDLVGHLLEFRRTRDLARRLGRLWEERSALHPRGWTEKLVEEPEEEEPIDLEEIDAWGLLELYGRLARQVGLQRKFRVTQARRPIRYYLQLLLERLQRARQAAFEELFDRAEGRMGLIGLFVALLELVKRGYARCDQPEDKGRILVEWCGPDGCGVDEILSHQGGGEAPEEPRPASN